MKNITLFILCLSFCGAQAQPDDESRWMVGIHGGFNQYRGEMGNGWYSTNQAAYSFGGVSLTYLINRHFDVSIFGTRGDVGYKLPWDKVQPGERGGFLLRKTSLNLLARYYFLGREPFFQPFVFAGAGVLMQRPLSDNSYPGQSGIDYGIPEGGVGFNIRLARFMLLQFQETFVYSSADYVDYSAGGLNDMYVMHSVGLLITVPKFKRSHDGPDLVVDKCPPMPKELQAKKAAKKRTKAKEKAEKKRYR